MPPGALDRAWFILRVRKHLQDGASYGIFRLRKLLTPTAQDRALVSLPVQVSFLYYPIRLCRAAGLLGLRGFKNLVGRYRQNASDRAALTGRFSIWIAPTSYASKLRMSLLRA